MQNLQILILCKELYKNVYNSVADNLHEYFNHIPEEKRKEIDKNLRLNYFFTNFYNQDNSWDICHAYSSFYYELGRFPGNQEMTIVPQGDIPKFINGKKLFLYTIYIKKFRSTERFV